MTKEKLLEVLEICIELDTKTAMQLQSENQNIDVDKNQMVKKYKIARVRTQDEKFFKTGVEEEEVE